jgi:NADPH:quinone reductase-like Zn-dependent oxidoreductase
MDKMKAVVFNKKASHDKLIYCDADKPVPKDNEVLIKIKAVSLNAADYRSMKMGLIPKGKIFGADIAGYVESAGKSITQFRPGNEVMGDLASFGFGGCAEYVAVPERAIITKPSKISYEEAAALPLAGLTALQALRDKGKIQKGYKVLIVGCAGGVGTFAIQLAKYFDTEVTGVCSTKNVQQSESLGADFVIDYTKEEFSESGTLYNLILGINGNYPLLSYRKCLAPNGIYVMVGGSLSQILKSLLFGRLLSFGSKKMASLSAKANTNDLKFLGTLLENGNIRPIIDRKYSLEMTGDAMAYLSQGHSTGKVIITV